MVGDRQFCVLENNLRFPAAERQIPAVTRAVGLGDKAVEMRRHARFRQRRKRLFRDLTPENGAPDAETALFGAATVVEPTVFHFLAAHRALHPGDRLTVAALLHVKDDFPVFQDQCRREAAIVLGDEAVDDGRMPAVEERLDNIGRNGTAADVQPDAEGTALPLAGIRPRASDDLTAADGTGADDLALRTGIADAGERLVFMGKDLADLLFGEVGAVLHRHDAAEHFLERLPHFGGFVFIHDDPEVGQRLNEILAVRQNQIRVLLQFDIFGAARVVDDAGARRLRPEFEPLENRAVILFVARALFTARHSAFLARGTGALLLERVFQIVVERFDRVVARRGRLLLLRGERGRDDVAHRKVRQEFILLGIIVVFRPPGVEDRRPLEDELFVFPAHEVQLAALHPARVVAEHGDEAAEHGTVHLFFPLVQVGLFGDFISRRQRRVRLDLAVVEDILGITERDGIPQFRDPGEDLTHLALFGGSEVLRVGTRIGQKAALV